MTLTQSVQSSTQRQFKVLCIKTTNIHLRVHNRGWLLSQNHDEDLLFLKLKSFCVQERLRRKDTSYILDWLHLSKTKWLKVGFVIRFSKRSCTMALCLLLEEHSRIFRAILEFGSTVSSFQITFKSFECKGNHECNRWKISHPHRKTQADPCNSILEWIKKVFLCSKTRTTKDIEIQMRNWSSFSDSVPFLTWASN